MTGRKHTRPAFHLTMAANGRLWDKTAWLRPVDAGGCGYEYGALEPRRLQAGRRVLHPHHLDRVKRAPHCTQRASCAARRVIQPRPFRPPRVWAQHLQRQHMRRAHRHTPAAPCAALQVDGGLGLAGCAHGGQHSAGAPQWGLLVALFTSVPSQPPCAVVSWWCSCGGGTHKSCRFNPLTAYTGVVSPCTT